MRKEPANIRFWRKVLKTESCWLWVGCKDTGGYGLFFPTSKETIHAHRFAYILTYGEFDETLDVLHNCPDGDNRLCVNPAHLWLGTHEQNMQDKMEKGRWKASPLNPELVRAIRKLHDAGHSKWSLAGKYNVSWACINRIIKRQAFDGIT